MLATQDSGKDEEERLRAYKEQFEVFAEENMQLRMILKAEALGSMEQMDGLRALLCSDDMGNAADQLRERPAVTRPSSEPPANALGTDEGSASQMHRSLHWKRSRLAALEAKRVNHEKWLERIEALAKELHESQRLICNEFDQLQNSIVNDTALYLAEVKKSIMQPQADIDAE